MSVKVATARSTRTVTQRFRAAKGISANRSAYDARRRRVSHDTETRQYVRLVRNDPCAICGHLARAGEERNAIDHIQSLRDHGQDDWTNMTCLCRRCNASKKDRPLLLWMLGAA